MDDLAMSSPTLRDMMLHSERLHHIVFFLTPEYSIVGWQDRVWFLVVRSLRLSPSRYVNASSRYSR
ncbi:hypothetical protein E2C01_045096 [Portunus trituberculatus]|uniref:Uncharacterized protein n=1 Tax=Portunus trituberculatus TaxID=210409 RepID=A0A5B7G1W4_PORTR|nr:hypothetical protein [Portunus trituberculatus]